MDLKQYYSDMRKKELELERKYTDGVVHVTSLFYRERNSTPGSTTSVTTRNGARVITDGTHREATEEEIDAFYDRQEKELERNTHAEQLKKQQYVVVTGERPAQNSQRPTATLGTTSVKGQVKGVASSSSDAANKA